MKDFSPRKFNRGDNRLSKLADMYTNALSVTGLPNWKWLLRGGSSSDNGPEGGLLLCRQGQFEPKHRGERTPRGFGWCSENGKENKGK